MQLSTSLVNMGKKLVRSGLKTTVVYIINFVTAVFENFKIGSYFYDSYFKSKIRTLKVRTVL